MEAYNIEKIGIRKMNVFLSSDKKQKQLVICRADKAGSLFGKYFVAHDADGGNHAFYLDDVAVTDPENYQKPTLPSTGWTDHRVAIAQNASATQIAAALKTAFDAVTGKFAATATGKNLIVELGKLGYAHPMRDALVDAKTTGFGFRVIDIGFSRISIGAIEGDIEISGMTQTEKDIQIHQEGETSLGKVISGYNNPEFKCNQYETDKESIKRALLMVGGQTILPEIEDADESVGYGPVSLGGQKPFLKVELVPVEADEADKSENWTIWKAQFNLESFTFARTEFATIPLTGTMFPDNTKPKAIQFYLIGDPAPYLPAVTP